jgi:hypothetical protein
LAEATPSSLGFQWFTRKPLGPLVVGVLDRQTYQGVPEAVDCAVRIVIGRPRTRRRSHKAKTEDPKTELQQRQTGLTGGYRSDRWGAPVYRCATTHSGDFEAEETRRDRMACVEATQGAVAEHPSDGEDIKTSKSALEGFVSLVIRKGHFRHSVPPYNPRGERMAANSWNPSSFAFLFSLPIFLGFP